MYDAVVFDVDGVILRGRETDPAVYRAAGERVLAEFDVAPDEELVAAFVDPGTTDAFRRRCEGVGIPPDRAWERREAIASELAAERFRNGERAPYDDADVLDDLAEMGVPVGLVSNNRDETISFVVEHHDLPISVHRGRDPTLEGFERMKPDPHYLLETLAALDADTALYVGDRYSDVEAAARATGDASTSVAVDSVLLERPDGDPGEPVGEEPTARITTLRELPALVMSAERSE